MHTFWKYFGYPKSGRLSHDVSAYPSPTFLKYGGIVFISNKEIKITVLQLTSALKYCVP